MSEPSALPGLGIASFASRFDLVGLLNHAVDTFGGRTALEWHQGGHWGGVTFNDLGEKARALGAKLAQAGVGSGDRVMLSGELSPGWVAGLFAIIRLGAIAAPVDKALRAEELAAACALIKPRLLLCDAPDAAFTGCVALDFRTSKPLSEPGASLPPRNMTEPALIALTSGTTGKPRGVLISLSSLLFEVEALRNSFGTRADDVFLSVLPPHHLLELTGGILGALFSGARIVRAPSLLPNEVSDAAARGVTVMLGVPLLYRALLHHWTKRGPRPASLRALICGGAPLDPDTEIGFEKLGLPMLPGYGMTECSPVISINTISARRMGTVGRLLPGVELKFNQNEILVRGPNLMLGYFDNAEATRHAINSEGWLQTGDTGVLETDGFLRITGRIKNLIVLGSGKKVQPEEVEAALGSLPGVAEFCVLGVTCKTGQMAGTEQVWLAVVPAIPTSDMDKFADELKATLAARLAPLSDYKRPIRTVPCRQGLPRSAAGKVLRVELRAWLEKEIQ